MVTPGPFKLERYFAGREFKAKHLLSSSECESLGLEELLGLFDGETRGLWNDLRLGYTESAGHPVLRREIASLYRGLGSDDIVVLSPGEGILIALTALLGPGDHAVVTFPAYQSLTEIPAARGCATTLWPLELDGGGWALDPDFLERRIGKNTRVVAVNFPHNPTGCHLSRDRFARVVEICEKHGVTLFSDEMYRFLEHDEGERLEAAASLTARGVSLSGLSKSFGLPGLRIGWLASRDKRLIGAFSRLRDYTTLCSSAPSEILAIGALRAKDRILARNRSIVLRNLEIAGEFFERHRNLFTWVRPRAGSVSLARLNRLVPVADFCENLFRRRGVMLLPGSVFDLEGNYFRVGIGRSGMEEGLGVLEDYLLGEGLGERP
jgi:aspartate/methionine/tyrosine aminotransferase